MGDYLKNKLYKVKSCKKTFYYPISSKDLLKLNAHQLSDMIISMANISKKIKNGEIETDGLLEELQSRIMLVDGLLEIKLNEWKDIDRRKEMLHDLKCRGDIDSLPQNINDIPVDVLQEMLSELWGLNK